METIKLSAKDKKVMAFENPFDKECTISMTVRKWTLDELVTINNLVRNTMADEYSARRKLEVELHDKTQSMSFKDFREKGESYNEYKVLDDEIKQLRDNYEVHSIMRKGIAGAMRYALGKKFNEVIATVLPKYVGKKCGPKTYDKFKADICKEIGIDGLRFCSCHSHVDFYGFNIDVDGIYEESNLTDNENKFMDSYKLQEVHDGFDGYYPDDWSEWARLVQSANDQIQHEFDEYISKQDRLVKALKIGNVAMKRVYSFDLKERA